MIDVSSNIAIGDQANASGDGTKNTAVGAGSAAIGNNSTALGAGAQATQDNEVAVGTAGNSYTLAGATSAQSSSRQSGDISFVTTDADGHLAATPMSGWGPSGDRYLRLVFANEPVERLQDLRERFAAAF